MKKPNRHQSLKILVVENLEGDHQLMVQSAAGINPAGLRLERAEPLPVKEFSYFDPAEAEVARKRLQDYLDKQ